MPNVNFQIDKALADPSAAAPLLIFKVRICNANAGETIQSIALRSQVRIEAARRRYSAAEQQRLVDLFGEPDRWSTTLGSLLWTHANTVVPAFEDEVIADLPVPCTFDFNVAATKYFEGLDEGEIPLDLQFSGTIFYRDADELLQVAQIPWDREASFRLPVDRWREMMEQYYPNCAWLRLRRDAFDRLRQYKEQQGLTHWEAAIDRLLSGSKEGIRL